MSDPEPAPHVPGKREREIDLPDSDASIPVTDLDMGLREVTVDGATYGVVMDIHPLTRFVPPAIVDTLEATVEPGDESDRFGTHHLLAMVREEYPDEVTNADVADNGNVGYNLVWLTAFDGRRLHEIVVELIVELMEHAVSHAEDDDVQSEFEEQLQEFDVATFVEAYRDQRDFEDEHDSF
jgi:hypothetical protein